jgi:hypothetical protein
MAAALCLTGCHQTIQLVPPNRATEVPIRQVSWSNHFVLGFVGREVIETRDYCPGFVVQSMKLESTVPTVLVGLATLGMYVPRRLVVTCSRTTR